MASHTAPSSVASPAGVHMSSYVAWASYAAGFTGAQMATGRPLFDIATGGTGAWALGAGVVAFFGCAIALQRYMGLALSSSDFGSPARLVRSGPFALSRNPIYLAFLLPIAALGWYSLAVSVATGALYVLAMNRFVIAGEESDLARAFGADFDDWARATPRWLLRLP